MNTVLVLAAILVGAYLVSCYSYPYSACPWCGSKQRRTDSRGNWRLRKRWLLHRLLHPQDPYRRLGARLIRRG